MPRLIATILLLAAVGSAQAQVPEEFTIEGPITAVNPAAPSITIMGIVIPVPAGMMLATPTNPAVPLAALTAPLPGRATGFIGGTAIAEGTTLGGIVALTDLSSDVVENVVVGEATAIEAAIPGALKVNGLLVRPSTDSRLPSRATNELGLAILADTIALGSAVAVDGYLGDDGSLYYHSLQADTAQLANPGIHEVGIGLPRCREEGGRLEIRGGVHDPLPPTGTPPFPTGTVELFALAADGTSQPLTRAPLQVQPEGDLPGLASYRFRDRDAQLADCRGWIRAVYTPAGGASVETTVLMSR